MEARELKFLATPEKGEVSALLVRPPGAKHILVLGHGASTDMRHATLQAIADRLVEAGVATFRYNFPYPGNGKGLSEHRIRDLPSPIWQVLKSSNDGRDER